MGYSDEELDREKVQHEELAEAAWNLIEGGMSMAEVLGACRQSLLQVAIQKIGNRRDARKVLKIGTTTVYRIEKRGNKY